MSEPPTWTCASCGDVHSGLVTVFGPEAPDAWVMASDEERAGGELHLDTCVLPLGDQTHHFLRGQLDIPVHDADVGVFTWSVWVSLSAESWGATVEHWDDPDRAALPPMFGWLSTSLSPYDQPTNPLATHVHTRPPGLAPFIEVDPSLDHPLAREQVAGISLHRVAELNSLILGG